MILVIGDFFLVLVFLNNLLVLVCIKLILILYFFLKEGIVFLIRFLGLGE